MRVRIAGGLVLALLVSACGDNGRKSETAAPAASAPAMVPERPGERPAPPSWGLPLIHKELAVAAPQTVKCQGGVDGLRTRYRDGQQVAGWAWDTAEKRPYDRVVAVNRKGRFVGFGDVGIARPDVVASHPEITADAVGWTLVTTAPAPNGVQIYAVDFDKKSACLLGKIDQIP